MPIFPKLAAIEQATYRLGDGRTIQVNPERMQHWVDSHRAMKSAGLSVPCPWDHNERAYTPVKAAKVGDYSAKDNAGWLADLKLEGERIDALLDIPSDADAEKFKTGTVKDISFGIGDFTDGDGKVWKDVIIHAAPVLYPVNHHQGPLVTMSLGSTQKLGDDWRGKVHMALATAADGGNDETIRALLTSALHLLGGGDEEDPMEKEKQKGHPDAKAKELQYDANVGMANMMSLGDKPLASLVGELKSKVESMQKALATSARESRRASLMALRGDPMPVAECDRLLAKLDAAEFALGDDGKATSPEIDAAIRAYEQVRDAHRKAGISTLMSLPVQLRGDTSADDKAAKVLAPTMSERINERTRKGASDKKRIAV